MALQHFYSRVPSRISMYNRADSFDTFARSENLEREFIEKELSLYEDIRLTPKEGSTLRMKGLEPLYFQYKAKSGELIQSCASFIPQDYTGERSAYLIHSLVMPEDEAHLVAASPVLNTFDVDMFDKDISHFDITNPEKGPDRHYPEALYKACEVGPLDILEGIGTNTMQRFLYVALTCLCGKLKAVYFSVGLENDKVSDYTMRFMNQFMQILPYHLRTEVSFVSRLADQNRFTGIKFKSVTDEIGNIPPAKGAVISLKTGNFLGFKDEEVGKNFTLVEFFFNLIRDDELRREFLLYADNAVKCVPALGQLTYKALSDLVFLFKVSSGRFDEMKVIPNDEVFYDFISIYEKNRTALTDEYRIRAMKTLKRYPTNYKEIPKKAWSRIVKFYGTEPACVKLVIMAVCLELIHTDVMRDKLYNFMADNFHNEPENVKEKIIEDLSRVYYGGFLMPQILKFFDENFKNLPERDREVIYKKVLLSLRTKAIEEQLISFLNNNYDILTVENKNALYKEIIENIAEGDDLASTFLGFINTHVEEEGEEFKTFVSDSISNLIEAEQKRKNHPLIHLLSHQGGYCGALVAAMIFSGSKSKKIVDEYIQGVCKGNAKERSEKIVNLFVQNKDMSRELIDQIYTTISDHFDEEMLSDNAFDLLDAAAYLEDNLINGDTQGDVKVFAKAILDNVWPKYIARASVTVFGAKAKEDGAARILEYAILHEKLKDEPAFILISSYGDIKGAIEANDCVLFVNSLRVLLSAKKLEAKIAETLDKEKTDSFLKAVAISILKNSQADFNAAYNKGIALAREGQDESFDTRELELSLLDNMICIIREGIKEDGPIKDILDFNKCGINLAITSFAQKYGKDGKEMLTKYANSLEDDLKLKFNDAILRSAPPKKGLFDGLKSSMGNMKKADKPKADKPALPKLSFGKKK